ncbi:MAG: S26 family signal peptidase [Rhodocyclaceae bacterium]
MTTRLQRWQRNRLPLILWLMATCLYVGRGYMLTVNLTDSLPGHVFLIEKGRTPVLGELAAFRWEGSWPYPRGSIFVKILRGGPGSRVEVSERNFYLDGQFVGTAKERARSGEFLEKGPSGVLPPGHYYVAADHPDSLDSRYRLTGWIRPDQIIGRARRLW